MSMKTKTTYTCMKRKYYVANAMNAWITEHTYTSVIITGKPLFPCSMPVFLSL